MALHNRSDSLMPFRRRTRIRRLSRILRWMVGVFIILALLMGAALWLMTCANTPPGVHLVPRPDRPRCVLPLGALQVEDTIHVGA